MQDGPADAVIFYNGHFEQHQRLGPRSPEHQCSRAACTLLLAPGAQGNGFEHLGRFEGFPCGPDGGAL
eukprot:scaffold164223_cov12-Tisochrysis_lutea.AAC.1